MNYYNQPMYVKPTPPSNTNYQTNLPIEQSYIENILRLNKGKKIKVYQTFPD